MRIGQKLSIPLMIIATGNLINGIHRGKELIYYFSHVGIFIAIIPFIFFIKKDNKRLLSFILLGLSCIGVWFGDYTDLVSITLFCFSLFLSGQNKKNLYIYVSIILVFIIIKFTLLGLNASQMAVFLAGSSFIFIFYHHYIHPKPGPPIVQKHYLPGKINSDVVDIVHLRVQGFDWPEINDKLELNVRDSRIPVKVREERKRHGFNNQEEFIFWMIKNGVISSKMTDASLAAEKRDRL